MSTPFGLEMGTLAGWITAISTTGGMATVIGIVLRYRLGTRRLTNEESADIRDHYAAEVGAMRDQLMAMERHYRDMLDKSDSRHAECEKARVELRGTVNELTNKIEGLERQLKAVATDRVLILEGTPVADKAPHSMAAAKRIKDNNQES